MKVLIIFRLILSVVNIVSISSISDEVVAHGDMTRGQDAEVDHFKYQVLIDVYRKGDRNNRICGGSIISNEWVLTAAHCLFDINTAYVYLGMTVLSQWEKKYEITSADILLHSDWQRNLPFNSDIALIKIPRTKFSERIQPVKLPSMNETNTKYGRQNVVTTGWGVPVNEALPKRLRFTDSKLIGKVKCQPWYTIKIRSTHICVSGLNGTSVSACTGDFGGPLVLSSSNVQIGIYSFNSKLGCQNGYPDVYTRITHYLRWIEFVTRVSY